MTMNFHHLSHRQRRTLLLRALAAPSSSSSKTVFVNKQTSSSSSWVPLTRFQKLRLSPKERAIYLRFQALIHEQKSNNNNNNRASKLLSSLLERARSNARFNLQYLKSNANINFKKNIQTMKRLVHGEEEVWKDESSGMSSSSFDPTRLKLRNGDSSSSLHNLHNIDWERVPSEIISNVKRNTTYLSEWIHDVSGGKIPAFSRTPPPPPREDENNNNTTSMSAANDGGSTNGGSIATRIRNFHIMKQRDDTTTLVMDRYWIAKNMFFALLPGFIFHLYFLSKQDEMAEYYGKIEQMERERILGIESSSSSSSGKEGMSSGSGSNVPPLKNECIRNKREENNMMMGISSALIPEGGTAWDKLKMAVNDIFLGGVEKHTSSTNRAMVLVEGEQTKDEGKVVAGEAGLQSTTLHASIGHSNLSLSLPTNPPPQERPNYAPVNYDSVNDEHVTVQMLLERIRALEARIANSSTKENELQQRQRRREEEEHRIKRQVERVKQSPIKNRRDNVLEAKWKNEAMQDNSSRNISSDGKEEADGSENSFGMLLNLVNYALFSLEPYCQSVKESVVEKMRTIKSLGSPPQEETSILLPHNYNVDDRIMSAVATESDTTVNPSVGEDVRSFSSVIDPSVDKRCDENEHFDKAEHFDKDSRWRWIMNLWRTKRYSSPSHEVSSEKNRRDVG